MKTNKPLLYDKDQAKEMLIQSNLIEDVSMAYAHEDAMKAWKYIVKINRLTEKDILQVHSILMKRFNPRIAGKLRTCDVWIGGHKRGYFGEAILSSLLGKVLIFIDGVIITKNDKDLSADFAQEAHIMFEDVHPFEDGNGRVGRIIYNWHRLQLGLPIHVIHVGQEQYDYYKWFK